MYMQNIDTKLQKKVQSKEFEESVDQAVRSFMYELDSCFLRNSIQLLASTIHAFSQMEQSSGLTLIENPVDCCI